MGTEQVRKRRHPLTAPVPATWRYLRRLKAQMIPMVVVAGLGLGLAPFEPWLGLVGWPALLLAVIWRIRIWLNSAA